MKKTYIAPSLKVVTVEVSHLMGNSLENQGVINNVEGDAREFGGLVFEEEEVE